MQTHQIDLDKAKQEELEAKKESNDILEDLK